MIRLQTFSIIAFAALAIQACNSNKDEKAANPTTQPRASVIAGNEITYQDDSVQLKGFVAYDSTTNDKRPVVLVLPEWWGIGDYTKGRAKQLAELGYLAIAVDMYGNGAEAADPEAAGKMAAGFYADPQMAKRRFDAALARILSYPQADAAKVAAIGYCFGGAQVLNVARLGEKLNGVVSFHGNLVGVKPDKNTLKARILICHGEADQFVKQAEVDQFRKQMDSAGIAYTFKSYPGATHAFTNPAATVTGKKFRMPIEYDEAADKASWNDMKAFFADIFK